MKRFFKYRLFVKLLHYYLLWTELVLTPASLLDLEFLHQNFMLEFHTRAYESFFKEISQIIENNPYQFVCQLHLC